MTEVAETPKSLTLPAPAKLNLFLHVTGRRGDGYHLLESLMCNVVFGDEITLSLRGDGSIHLQNPLQGVKLEDDLCAKAAATLATAYQAKGKQPAPGLTIALTKRIPMGAGLGGGSSDAASVLLGYNALLGKPFSRSELLALALPLGADVPFFVFGQAALARGIGEALTPVSLPSIPVWIAVPNVHVPTPSIFKDPHLTRDTATLSHDAAALCFGRNDLQAVAKRLHPAIGDLLDAWPGSRMSGSGCAVFGFTPCPVDTSEMTYIATRLVSRHPAHGLYL